MASSIKDEKFSSAEHIESTQHAIAYGDEDATTISVHIPAALAGLPMSPSADLIRKSVILAEHSKVEPVGRAFRNEWRALLFCAIYVWAAMGQGVDSGAGNITYNMPAFLIKFGAFNPETKSLYAPSLWLGLWQASSSFGNFVGSLGTGAFTDRFGYKRSQIGGCVFSLAAVCLQVFAVNRLMIFFGKLLNGISQGLFVAISAGYISEVAGNRTRAAMMSLLAAIVVVGIVTAIGIGSNANIIGNVYSDWGSWRLMYAVQWIIPATCIPLLIFTPESPTQCVKRGDPAQALRSLRRMRKVDSEEELLVRLAAVQVSVAASIEDAKTGSATYADCFRGTDLKRTMTVMIMFCGVQFGGVALLSNGLYFLDQTGLAFATVSDIALAFLAISAVVCVSASIVLEKVGRRNVLVYGSFGHGILLVIVGALYYAQGTQKGLLAMAIVFNIAISTAQFANGAPVYALSIEISSVRLRSKTQSLGFAAYFVLGWITLFVAPYMYQVAPEGAGWGVRACWVFAGLTFGFAIWAYFMVGETQGRSYADIDELYRTGVSPRHFSTAKVNAEREAVA